MSNRISRPGAGCWALKLAVLTCLIATPPAHAAAANGPLMISKPWTPQLPNGWVMSEVSAVAVGPDDTVWVLQRPRALPAADRAHAAPAVLAFTSEGKYLRGFGGPGEGYEWPQVEHSLAVDAKGRIWITGSFRGGDTPADDMILAFDSQGKFLRQIGKRGASTGNLDHANIRAAADLFIDDARNELYVADGYANNRLVVFDTETGAFKRMWSAFGKAPPAESTPSPAATDTSRDVHNDNVTPFVGVHGVEIAQDGTVYVSDRANKRVQLFDRGGKYLRQFFVNRDGAAPLSASGIAFSADPEQRTIYVADWGNQQVWLFDRKTLAQRGKIDATFVGPHLMGVDSTGALYVAEVQGHRVSKWAPAP
ncbi:MAG: NHL repeat-containing protein [Rhodospirillaceae bacterium]|nr:NHL repeat-containing protein [Rhodospirillaceae bacterium]